MLTFSQVNVLDKWVDFIKKEIVMVVETDF